MVKEKVRDPGILNQIDWHTSVTFFVKEEVKSMEDWLGSMLLVKTYYFGLEMEEEIDWLNIMLSGHEEYQALLEDEAKVKDYEWFDEINNQVFSLKRKIKCRLKNAKERSKWKGSSRSSRSSGSKTLNRSKALKESRCSGGSTSSKRKSLKIKSGLQFWQQNQSC